MLKPISSVRAAFSEAWQHRWPFVLVHVSFAILTFSLIAPVMAQMIRVAIGISGQSALTDQDIAAALLSPLGIVGFIVITSFILSAAVLEVAVMMSVLRSEAPSPIVAARDGLFHVASRLKRMFLFAAFLVIRVLIVLTPGVLIALFVASQTMMEFDINYYIATRPPEFLVGAAVIALVLGVTVIFLIRQLLGWAVALPAVLFSDTAVSASFNASHCAMQGHKWPLVQHLFVWLLMRLALFGVVAFLLAFVAGLIAPGPETRLSLIALIVGTLLLAGALANGLVSSVCNGALAALLIGFTHQVRPDLAKSVVKPSRTAPARGLGLITVVALVGVFGTVLGYYAINQVPLKDDVEIIAHRGAAGARPENTIAAFEEAIAANADWIELDVQESADGQVIVIHDSDFMKLAENRLTVWDADMDKLGKIDIGSWFDPAYKDQRVPLLEDVLILAKDKVKVLVELKYYGHDEMLEQRVIELVEAHDMVDQVALMSLKYPAVQKVRTLRPEWRSGVLAATAIGDLTGFDADFLAVNTGMASRNFIGRAHDRGKDVYVWTVNEPVSMSSMISLGVNGLITDEPAMAREVLKTRANLSSGERILLALGARLGLAADSKSYRDASP